MCENWSCLEHNQDNMYIIIDIVIVTDILYNVTQKTPHLFPIFLGFKFFIQHWQLVNKTTEIYKLYCRNAFKNYIYMIYFSHTQLLMASLGVDAV